MRRLAVAAGLVVVVAGCAKQPARDTVAANLHCYQIDEANRDVKEAINPLIPTVIRCFEDEKVCSTEASTARASCSAVIPRWHCFKLVDQSLGRDPLAGISVCHPSLAMCQAARPGGELESSECHATQTVSCQDGNPSLCAAEEELCNLAREMPGMPPKDASARGTCTARHSAR